MSWLHDTLERLATARYWSYHEGGPPATEPAALAALALIAHRRPHDAQQALDWLTRAQSTSGTLGVTAQEREPCWPTALAVLAWQAWEDYQLFSPLGRGWERGLRANDDERPSLDAFLGGRGDRGRYLGCVERAVQWALIARGETSPNSPLVGHDSTLAGWPWVVGTHSWLEPTAYFVLALKAAGHGSHLRTREAVRLLVDRLLPSGGCNYGNTIVMGQELLPHVQPTGLVLMALADEKIDDRRIALSIDYLERALGPNTAPASLAFGLLGLAAHDRHPEQAEAWLEAGQTRRWPFARRAYTDALLALAAAGWRPGTWKE